MKAAVYRGIGQIAAEEMEKPVIKSNEYLVKVLYSGLCGTDIKTYKQGHRFFNPGDVLGHEFCGQIVEAGADMDANLIGKKVAVAPYNGCGKCVMCRKGFQELCCGPYEDRPGTAGAFTEYLTVDDRLAKTGMLVLEDDVDPKKMSLAEPFACILNSVGKSQVKEGQTALIVGAGPMGLLHIEGLKLMGASKILVSEFNETRGEIAAKMGAQVINPGKTPDVKAEIAKALEGDTLDHIFVCVGIPAVVEDAMNLADKGTTINIFGGLKSGCTITIDPNIIHYSEVKLVGTFGFSDDNYMTSAKMLASGQVDMSQMITHVFPLAEADKAFELGAHPTDDVVKILIEMA